MTRSAAEVKDAKSIFGRAAEIESPQERAAFLEQACRGDAALQSEIARLLAAAVEAGSFMHGPVVELSHTVLMPPLSEGPGTVIGPYKLMEQIGEGGFGLVFVAEQHRPVRRKVALKIIKPGMDTRDVIARFEAERQALALMDHPNIAKVFDAGTTDPGRPYFVMELVRGVPITDYCDQHHLTPRERLELFASVCHAIQHAHQKGIIHRDVKPTNVLVTLHDGVPVVKVIDFGVAKALSNQLTERTVYTQFAQMLGTPLYMSPEQAEMSGLDIDTRSDIYSLGVLLYELLTGTTPFDRERLKKAAALEIRRILAEEEPPKPSTRLTQLSSRHTPRAKADGSRSLPATLATIAAQRNTEPTKLSKLIRGDLDWIVMKCLEKDRNRRYETANGLASDIKRYLVDEPIVARPPSTWYQFHKFARRNKVALSLASAAIVTSLLVMAGLAVSNRLITAERNQKADALRQKEFALAQADAQRQRAEENFQKARIAVRGILTHAAMGRGEWAELPPSVREKFTEETVKFYQSFADQESSDPSLQHEKAVAYRALSEVHKRAGKFQDAERFIRESIAILKPLAAAFPQSFEYRKQLAWSHYVLATLIRDSRYQEAESSLQTAIGLYEGLFARRPEDAECFLEMLTSYADLVAVQHTRKEFQQVEQTADRIVELVANAPENSPATADVLLYVGERLRTVGRAREAALAWRKSLRLNPDNVNTHNEIAWFLAASTDESRDPQRAIELASRAVELSPSDGNIWNTLGVAQYRARDWPAAIRALNKSMELRHGGDSLDWFFLAMAEWQLGNHDTARAWYEKAIEWMAKHKPNDNELVHFRAEAAKLLEMRKPTVDQSAPVSGIPPSKSNLRTRDVKTAVE